MTQTQMILGRFGQFKGMDLKLLSGQIADICSQDVINAGVKHHMMIILLLFMWLQFKIIHGLYGHLNISQMESGSLKVIMVNIFHDAMDV